MPARLFALCVLLALGAGSLSFAAPGENAAMSQQEFDSRAAAVRNLDIHYAPAHYATAEQWRAAAAELRTHILACAGLVPMPRRTPLNALFLGKVDGDGYTVERVMLETLPGFFLGGNLYRPKGKRGPFPGIANPHGHWKAGRLEQQVNGSIPARCITFARMGCVAFAYDMIGYNDTRQVPHTYGGDRESLWGISLGGLQLWDSIRVLDFLESLPDVDKNRLACTGASGGGTQTFLLSAVDDRVKVAAPVNMISLLMQGGCLCENMPNLRVDANNVAIGAMMAPRPLLMVSATGDWTRNTLEEEYPAIKAVYALLGAAEKVHAVRFEAPHNYNQNSREAVYSWFAQWLLGQPEGTEIKEHDAAIENTSLLRCLADDQRLPGSLDAAGLTESLIARSEAQLKELWPSDSRSLRRFRETYAPVLRHALGAEVPAQVTVQPAGEPREAEGVRAEGLILGRAGKGDRVPALLLTRTGTPRRGAGTLVLHPEGIRALYDEATGRPAPFVASILKQGRAVLLIDAFLTGSSTAPETRAAELKKYKHITTYNRTDTDNRVQDILTALAYLRSRTEVSGTRVVGRDAAGLWALLACALDGKVETAALDLAGFDAADDNRYLHELWVPGLRRAGDLRTAAALSAPTKLLLQNAAATFPAGEVAAAYRAAGTAARFRSTREPFDEAEALAWLGK